jgi:NAD(P)-dependent dehydrogenase (short-subunit alcohol dehydrogenase family)
MGNVLVTGCSSGVGLATALELARRGERVFAGVRRPTAAEELRAAIDAESLDVTIVALDVCDQASVDAALAQIHAEVGALDALVNNAGISPFAAVEDQPLDEARLTFETNVFGPLRLMQAVVPGMRARGAGAIVNVSSVSGFVAVPFLGIYSASKFAIEAMSEVLDHEVRGAGIRVVLIRLGVFDTAIGDKSPAPPPSPALGDRAERAADMRLEMARSAPPTSVAATAIADAVGDAATPRHVLVGDDAVMMQQLHDSQSPDELFATMHAVYELP